MKPEISLRGALLVGGLITAAIGIGHIFMPDFGYDSSVPAAMDPVARAHFYYLATYAIAAFLLSLSLLSLYFSNLTDTDSPASLVVCSVLAAFWIVRACLEVIYPVDLRIFFLERPHAVLLPIIGFQAALYFGAALKGWLER